jgi:nitroreductase
MALGFPARRPRKTREFLDTAAVETWLAIASRREVREYEERPLAADVQQRILDAGRLAGSAKNRQPWRFLVVEDPARREQLAETVFEPTNVRGAAFVVAIAISGKGPLQFDAGRCASNMLLAAWDAGVGSSPNGLADADAAHAALGLGEDERVAIVLTFGYPRRPRDPASRRPEEWSARAGRKPLDELVERL